MLTFFCGFCLFMFVASSLDFIDRWETRRWALLLPVLLFFVAFLVGMAARLYAAAHGG